MEKPQKLSREQVIVLERDLAKYAAIMDSAVRIPFTRQGVGADAALSTVPIVGDIAGFVLTCYAIYKAKQIGVPNQQLTSVVKLAVLDAVVGMVPILGTVFDIFIRPSRRALDVVHSHIRSEYGIHNLDHVHHPFLHQQLEKKQAQSAFWRHPVVAWLWLRIPDLFGILVLAFIVFAIGFASYQVWQWLQA